jgi:hypothetical protein
LTVEQADTNSEIPTGVEEGEVGDGGRIETCLECTDEKPSCDQSACMRCFLVDVAKRIKASLSVLTSTLNPSLSESNGTPSELFVEQG